jgi:SPP1 gp7 family putative phage head morphogenesis protein
MGKPEAKEDEAEDEAEEKEEKMSCGCEVHTYKRELTSYEKKVNFAEAKKALDGSEDMLVPQIKRAAKLIYTDLIQQVKDKGILTRFNPEKINSLSPRFLKELNSVFKNNFKTLFKKSLKEAQLELFPNSTKGYAMDDDFLPEEFLKVLEMESFKMVGDYSTDITKKTKNAVTQAIKQGTSEAELAKILMEMSTDYTEKWASTVARTKTTEIYNQARKSYWDTDPLAKQIIVAYKFSAIMDSRTSDVCAELDKMPPFEKGDYTSVITPPLHFNCRSLLVPITKFEDYKPSKPISPETLQSWGGGLILPDSKKFASMPYLYAIGRGNAGDNIIIAAPEVERRIKVLSVSISNAMDTKAKYNLNGQFEGEIAETTGRWDKTFPEGWILEAGTPLSLGVSIGSGIAYTVEYILIDNMGGRIA